MKNILFSIYKYSFFFIPIPLFIDFSNLSVIYYKTESFNFILDRPKIPFPIGGIALFIAIIIGYIYSLIDSRRMKPILSPKKILKFYVFFVFPFFLHCFFIAQLSAPRIVQIILPVLILSAMSLPQSVPDRVSILKATIIGMAIFFILHVASIFSSAKNILYINEKLDFSSFYEIMIYQSLVSYPGVISLYFFLTLGIIYISKKQRMEIGFFQTMLVKITPLALLYLLAASGRRAFLVELFSGILIITAFSLFFVLKSGKIKQHPALYFTGFSLLSIIFVTLYLNSPLATRLINSISDNSLDSGRSDILSRAHYFFSNNISVLFFGAGGTNAPGFHNYFLDQVYRIGLLGFIPLYLAIVFLFVRFIKNNDLGTPHQRARTIFMVIILSCCFWQSVINASISQPYYFVNLLTVSMLSYFAIFLPKSSFTENKEPKNTFNINQQSIIQYKFQSFQKSITLNQSGNPNPIPFTNQSNNHY